MTNRIEGPIPVIVGVGDLAQRPGDGELDPIGLAVAATRMAAEDAGAPALLAVVDSIDVVNVISWSYADIAGELARAIGATPTRAVHTDVGGHQPIALLDDAAARIARGESEVALIAGAEAVRTLESALKQGAMPPWPAPPPDAQPIDPRAHAAGAMAELELFMPTDVYPLYEQASRAATGTTQADERSASARRWAAAAQVAAGNPAAWLRTPPSADEIAMVGPANRMVAWPYPKMMNALLSVDQGAAVLVTSADRARAMGVPEERWVFPLGGSGASEPDDVLARSSFTRTTAGATVLDRTLALNGLAVDEVDLIELYSCFPVVPRMAAAHLGLAAGRATTVTGGLTFFGGPANDYMTHAIAAMVRAVRAGDGRTGLLYGQGGYATKHHAVVVSATPPDAYRVDEPGAAQQVVDDEPKPPFVAGYDGPGTLETFTMPYGRDGEPTRVVLVGRTPDGARFAGEGPVDADTVAVLTHPTDEPVGRPVRAIGDGTTTKVELV